MADDADPHLITLAKDGAASLSSGLDVAPTPESNAAPMTILVTTKEYPPELWKLDVSWDTVVRRLKDLEAENGDALVALD
jgi:hypothetical protein